MPKCIELLPCDWLISNLCYQAIEQVYLIKWPVSVYIVNIGKRVKALSLNSPVLLSTEMVKNCSVPMSVGSYFDCIRVSLIYIVRQLMFFHCCSFFSAKNQMEFCCHMLRGSVDPKKPPVYEYVKFIGNFKSLANSECLFSS